MAKMGNVAEMEGIWITQAGAPAVIVGLPDEDARLNRYEIDIPKLASLYLTHEWEGVVLGLDDFVGNHPPVRPVFIAFRVMVGIGMLMWLVSWSGVVFLKPWRSYFVIDFATLIFWQSRYLQLCVGMTFSGWVVLLAGWYVTEISRQL